ncbi:MAG: metalloregulator ArsR/SmtB family transcription factor [bacterium]
MSSECKRKPKKRIKIPDIKECEKVADVFKALSDPARLRVVRLLTGGELCSGEIAETLKIDNTTASHQLRNLKKWGIISSRKDGRYIIYSIENECVLKLLKLVDEHLDNC